MGVSSEQMGIIRASALALPFAAAGLVAGLGSLMTELVISLIWNASRTRKKGVGEIARRERARLADMVAHARVRSPYYREQYRNLGRSRSR